MGAMESGVFGGAWAPAVVVWAVVFLSQAVLAVLVGVRARMSRTERELRAKVHHLKVNIRRVRLYRRVACVCVRARADGGADGRVCTAPQP